MLAVAAAVGCHEPPKNTDAVATPPGPAAAATPAQTAAPMTIAFAAYGSQGPVPVDAADEYYRVLAYVAVRAPARASGVSVRAVDVSGGGVVESRMRKLESVQRLPSGADLTPPAVWNTHGSAFDGELPPGETKLRIEAWLTHRPAKRPLTLRVELAGPTLRAVATSELTIEWPTG